MNKTPETTHPSECCIVDIDMHGMLDTSMAFYVMFMLSDQRGGRRFVHSDARSYALATRSNVVSSKWRPTN